MADRIASIGFRCSFTAFLVLFSHAVAPSQASAQSPNVIDSLPPIEGGYVWTDDVEMLMSSLRKFLPEIDEIDECLRVNSQINKRAVESDLLQEEEEIELHHRIQQAFEDGFVSGQAVLVLEHSNSDTRFAFLAETKFDRERANETVTDMLQLALGSLDNESSLIETNCCWEFREGWLAVSNHEETLNRYLDYVTKKTPPRTRVSEERTFHRCFANARRPEHASPVGYIYLSEASLPSIADLVRPSTFGFRFNSWQPYWRSFGFDDWRSLGVVLYETEESSALSENVRPLVGDCFLVAARPGRSVLRTLPRDGELSLDLPFGTDHFSRLIQFDVDPTALQEFLQRSAANKSLITEESGVSRFERSLSFGEDSWFQLLGHADNIAIYSVKGDKVKSTKNRHGRACSVDAMQDISALIKETLSNRPVSELGMVTAPDPWRISEERGECQRFSLSEGAMRELGDALDKRISDTEEFARLQQEIYEQNPTRYERELRGWNTDDFVARDTARIFAQMRQSYLRIGRWMILEGLSDHTIEEYLGSFDRVASAQLRSLREQQEWVETTMGFEGQSSGVISIWNDELYRGIINRTISHDTIRIRFPQHYFDRTEPNTPEYQRLLNLLRYEAIVRLASERTENIFLFVERTDYGAHASFGFGLRGDAMAEIIE